MRHDGVDEMTHDRDSADSRLEAQLARLPLDVQPGKDLWSGIEGTIRSNRRRQDDGEPSDNIPWWSQSWAGVAAAVVLVVASSLTTFALVDREAPAVSNASPWALDGVGLQFASYPMGPQYMEARRTLSATLESRVADLQPDTRKAVEASLEEIRQALAEIDEALRDDPNNVLLQQLLLATYQDELAVLSNLNLMTRNLAVRTDL